MVMKMRIIQVSIRDPNLVLGQCYDSTQWSAHEANYHSIALPRIPEFSRFLELSASLVIITKRKFTLTFIQIFISAGPLSVGQHRLPVHWTFNRLLHRLPLLVCWGG